MTYSGWFTRYHPSTNNPEVITTQWEFGIDGLTEEQAIEIDRRIQEVVAEVQGEQSDGTHPAACGPRCRSQHTDDHSQCPEQFDGDVP